jgi:hypothetical protein
VVFAGIGVLLSVCPFVFPSGMPLWHQVFQAAKGVSSSRETLSDLFPRIRHFLACLDIYTEVSPTTAATRIVIEIMAEILTIFTIATKEIKRPAASELVLERYVVSTTICSVSYLKKLTRNRDIEDALQPERLDTLTQEEVRMAQAELWKIVHDIERPIPVTFPQSLSVPIGN